MIDTDLVYLDATELTALVRSRDISPVEVVAALRSRAQDVGSRVNALVTDAPDAEERAREAEAAVVRGDELRPLHGVPFTVKDTFDTAGLRTTRGSLLFADHVPGRDATAVARLREAGAILLAKSNTPEFALWWETGNRVFGTTSNPWSLDRTSGGSTGGEAAALAAGLTPLGLGSDVGGSIRAPAHCCGVVGFKPSHGLVPLTGHWPETLQRFMHVGPLARSVRDAALALSLLAGPDGADHYALPVAIPASTIAAGLPEGLSVGVLADRSVGPVDPDVSAAVRAAAAALADLGAHVEEAELPRLEAADCNLLTITLYGGEGGPYFSEVVAGREADLHPVLRARLGAPQPNVADYVAAEHEVEALRRELAVFFQSHDLLLCPTAPAPAPLHEAAELVLAGQSLVPRTMLRATLPFDLTGSPALSLPFTFSAEGLPIGVQLVGGRFRDELVLRVAAALEPVAPAAGRRPPL